MGIAPTIGRIVHYHLIDTGKIAPAVVVDVTSDDHVTLFIMDPQEGAAFERNVRQGQENGCWEWPSIPAK